ncbi:MAG: hypothetical protein HFI29_10920 [Lachnospiraceae bacterium]|jgi:hypothetical protein|nr:hypothetical protein [Lachnospiraceae bacterium]
MNSEKETRTTVLFEELEEISSGQKSYQTFLKERKEEKTFTSLRDFINDYFAQHPDITPSVIIEDSNLSKNYVYPICNGTKNPSKYKLTAFCIGAHMSLRETQKALSLAGCAALHPKVLADAGIIVCINKGCRNVTEVELFLDENGVESPFGGG